jgi:hypothetical protein
MQCGSATDRRLLKTLGASASDGTVYVERSMRSAQIFADLDPVDDAYQIIHEHYAKLVDDLLTGHDANDLPQSVHLHVHGEGIDAGSRREDAISRGMMEVAAHETAFLGMSVVVDAEADAVSVLRQVEGRGNISLTRQ